MAQQLTTQSLATATAESLSWLSGHGFSYFKSNNHYRRKNANGFSYITINAVTHDRANYHLAFYLAVQITSVESWLLSLRGDTRKVGHFDQTIWNYTVNIGPNSPHWSFPIQGTWTLAALDGFSDISAEIATFVRDLALPFVTDHQEPLALRRTLIDQPGHAQNIYPYQQILAIDQLYAEAGQTEKDIALLDERYRKYAPRPRQEFDEFVTKIRTAVKT